MREILQDLNKVRLMLSGKSKRNFMLLLGLMIVASVLEAIGIGAIPAFVTLVMRPSALSENQWVGSWFAGFPDQITLSLLVWASVVLLAFVAFKNAFLAFVSHVQIRIAASEGVRLSDRMFGIYQAAPLEWHVQRNSSEFLRSIQHDTAQLLGGVVVPALNLIMAIIMTVVIVLVLLVSTPGVTILALIATIMGLLLIIRVFQNRLRHIGVVTRHETKERVKAIQQGFAGLVDSRVIGCEKYLREVHLGILKRLEKANVHQQTMQRATPYAMETFAVFGMLIILFLLVMSADSLASVLPTVVLLGVVMMRLKQFASQIAGSMNLINMARASIPAVVNDFKELEAISASTAAKKSNGGQISHFQRLHLDSVTYSYPSTMVPAVRDITLQVNRGESIALIGATGCGKSTLVNIILGLLEPQSGRVLVNGININADLDGWLAHLGYIPQSVYLIDDTIRANVAFGMDTSTVEEQRVWSTLDAACLSTFVRSLPAGLDTIVGERGVRLSGGQRQRLGIARAIYNEPEVLVMDEATSALDNKTEAEVMQAIKNVKRNRTLIMIAHRLSTVEDCDRLYYLKDGEVTHVGTFGELMKSSAAFRELARDKDPGPSKVADSV